MKRIKYTIVHLSANNRKHSIMICGYNTFLFITHQEPDDIKNTKKIK